MEPIKLMVHAHYKPTGKVAHMVSLQIPDNNFDFDHPFRFRRDLWALALARGAPQHDE